MYLFRSSISTLMQRVVPDDPCSPFQPYDLSLFVKVILTPHHHAGTFRQGYIQLLSSEPVFPASHRALFVTEKQTRINYFKRSIKCDTFVGRNFPQLYLSRHQLFRIMAKLQTVESTEAKQNTVGALKVETKVQLW